MLKFVLLLVLALIHGSWTLSTIRTASQSVGRCHHSAYQFHYRLFGTSVKSETETENRLLDTSSISGDNGNNEYNDNIIVRYGILAMVPILWGTYTPIVKGLYSSIDQIAAPPPVLFNLFSFIVSFSVLSSTKFTTSKMVDIKTSEIKAGIELGMYLFIGSFIQILGIQQTSATRASILVQLTTIIVPVLDDVLNKRKKSNRVVLYSSCLLAFVGVLLITDINLFEMSTLLDNATSGDVFVCFSAIFYSLHIVRLGYHASEKTGEPPINPVNLVLMKSLTELVLSFLYIASNHAVAIQCGNYIKNSWNSIGLDNMNGITSALSNNIDGMSSLSSGLLYVIFAVLWNGIFATALTNWAQTYGQSRVNPTTANLIYSSQPIWGGIFAAVFLHDATSNSKNFIIGSIILGASIVAAIAAASPVPTTTAASPVPTTTAASPVPTTTAIPTSAAETEKNVNM